MNKQQRHILFVASWYPNRNNPILGSFIERHAHAAALRNKVSVVAAFSQEGENEMNEQHQDNLSEFILLYPKVKVGDKITTTVRKVKAYRRAIRTAIDHAISKNGKPDILHVHVAWPAALAVLPIASELNIPIVISEHWSGYLPEDGNYRGYFLKRYTKKLFGIAKVVTVVSEKMHRAMGSHGLDSDFRILPNAADVDVFNYSEENVRPNDEFRLLHVSMLVDREKNISGMLEAIAQASNLFPLHLTIIGDGPEREKHEAYCAKLGIQSYVTFEGLRSAKEIAFAMNTHDALIMFSHFEGMPATIIEAQCCGMPVIATETGSIKEMLTNLLDIVVTPGDVRGLVDAIDSFRKNLEVSNDIASLRRRISIIASEKYSLEAVGKELDTIYDQVTLQK